MSEHVEERRRRTQGRSPPFPFIPLGRAVARAQELLEHTRGHPVRVISAVSAWKYNLKSSGGMQTLAALKGFGLLIDAPNGQDRKVQLSELALRLLRNPPESARRDLLKRAALAPKLINEYWRVWGLRRPPDDDCLWTLQDERGFTADAAARFLSVYDSTLSYAGLADSDSMPPAASDMHEDVAGQSEEPEKDTPEDVTQPSPPIDVGQKRGGALMPGERELTTGPLSKGASFRLIVSGEVGPKEIERLIRNLELVKETLAEDNEGGGKPGCGIGSSSSSDTTVAPATDVGQSGESSRALELLSMPEGARGNSPLMRKLESLMPK